MDRLDIAAACGALPPFIEALNNWYIRRSRDRFWKSEQDADKRAAYDTLYTALVTMTRVMAPFLPYLTETIHRALVDGESVHLQDWPDASAFAVDAGAGRAHGPRPRRLLGGCRDPHREEPAQPPAAPHAHHRASEARPARAAPRRHRRGGERQGGGVRRQSRRLRQPRCCRSIRASSASASAGR